MEKLPLLTKQQIEDLLRNPQIIELSEDGENYPPNRSRETIQEPLELQQTREETGSPVRSPINTDLTPWETSLTNPAKHSEREFRYLVHAVHGTESHTRVSQSLFMLELAMAGKNSHTSGRIDLLQQPRRIAEKPTISCSLMDEAHRKTWAPGGYILKVPADNILKTHAQDASNLFWRGKDLVAKLYEERDMAGIATPELLLGASSQYKYNEVVVAGTGRTKKEVEIAGVFLKYLPNGECLDENLAEQLRVIAWGNGWPIVKIEEQFIPHKDSAPDFDDDYFGFNSGGKRYIFNVRENYFYVSEFGGKKVEFMTLEQRAHAIGVVKEHLAKNPNKQLEALVAAAEKVPDSKLLEAVRIQNELRKPERPYESEPFQKLYSE